ncbi:MAG: PAS domain S-box protein [Deltaproteobacteria bacterium]|nr:PAS domain S-box protein [Deltaproteobacteria bacterium]
MKSKKPAKSSANNLFSKLQWLMFFRVVVVTLLLGATAIWQLQEREIFRYASLTPLYFLIGFTYVLTLLYALLLRRIQELKTFAYAQVLGDVFFVTLLIYFTGGIDSIFSWVYLLAIFSASTILYRRGGLLIASVSSILYGTLLDLQYYQVISSPGARLLQEPSYPSSYVFYLIAMNLVAFYLVALLSAYLAGQVRQKEEELTRRLIDYRQLEQLYKLIVQNVTSGLVTVDEQGRVTSFNHMAEDITDFKLEEVYHLKIGSLFPGIMEQHRNSGESPESGWENLRFFRWETKFSKKDGAVLTLGFSASALKDAQDQTIGSIIIFQDLTKLREMGPTVWPRSVVWLRVWLMRFAIRWLRSAVPLRS